VVSKPFTGSIPKDQGECGCGCGLFGALRRRPEGHVRLCQCPRCQGKRSRQKGDSKARKARKALGIAGANTRHEELWGGGVRVEVKAGKQVGPVWTRFLLAEGQSEQARPIGDPRPFVFVAMPEGTSDGLVVFRLSQVAAVLDALAENLGAA